MTGRTGRVHGKVAVVTGGANGTGRTHVRRLRAEGADVVAVDLPGSSFADEPAGTRLLTAEADVRDFAALERAAESAVRAFGRIDVLIANAGLCDTPGAAAGIDDDTWRRSLDINLTGVFLCNQAVTPIMIAQKSGSIINISSMAGKTSWPASAEYSASKSGVIGLTRSVAMELASYGATANAICPGNTKTEMVKNVASQIAPRDGISPDEWLTLRAGDCPMKRMATPNWYFARAMARRRSSVGALSFRLA